jgi:hypothetical protein
MDEPRSTKHEDKIYLVTHKQLSNGYQTAQTAHAVAELMMQRNSVACDWYSTSNSLIVLTAENAEQLFTLQRQAQSLNIDTVEFREPDLLDELTAVAFCPSADTRKLLSNLPLVGRRTLPQEPLLARESRFKELSYAMMDCEQTKGQSVLQHGRSVREHYFALVRHLNGTTNLHEASNWVVPEWVDTYKTQILAALPDEYVMDRYLTLHDSGKPAVRVFDEEGKHHFPDHANSSADTYLEVMQEEANTDVEYLIRHDMDIHMLTAVDVPQFITTGYAVAQLCAGLSELISNASMFGGVESVGFKMKYKKLNQRGKAICAQLFS